MAPTLRSYGCQVWPTRPVRRRSPPRRALAAGGPSSSKQPLLLVSENHKTRGLTTWSYDPAGNRLTAVTGNKVTTWSYDAADQLVSELKSLPGQTPWATAATFSYDLAGNRTGEQFGERFTSGWNNALVTYSWDPTERLLGIAHDSGTGSNVTNTYRPDGLRAKKVEGGATRHMIWDGNEVLAQVDGSGTLVSYYSRGASLVKQRNASGSTLTQSYLHLDSQGTVVQRSKDDGTTATGVLDPDPWGGDPGKRWGRVVVDSFTRADANALGTAETGQISTEGSSPATADQARARLADVR